MFNDIVSYDEKTLNLIKYTIEMFDNLIKQTVDHDFTIKCKNGKSVTFFKSFLAYIPYFKRIFSIKFGTCPSVWVVNFTKKEVKYIIFIAMIGSVFNKDELINKLPNGTIVLKPTDWLKRIQIAKYFGLDSKFYKDLYSNVMARCLTKENVSIDIIKKLIDLDIIVDKYAALLIY